MGFSEDGEVEAHIDSFLFEYYWATREIVHVTASPQ